MPKKRKTKEEKVKAAYRLQNFELKVEESKRRREQQDFGYLSKKYVKQDLVKTLVYTLIIVGLLIVAQRYFNAG